MTEQLLYQWLQTADPHQPSAFSVKEGVTVSYLNLLGEPGVCLATAQNRFSCTWTHEILQQLKRDTEQRQQCIPLSPQQGAWRWWIALPTHMSLDQKFHHARQLVSLCDLI